MTGRINDELRLSKPLSDLNIELFLNIMVTADRAERIEAPILKRYGLKPIQYNVLRILRGAGAEGLPCSAITERMISREPDITRLLDRLEQKNFVRRSRAEHDRRNVISTITPAGVQAIAPLDAELTSVWQQVFATMTPADKTASIDLLERCRAQMG